MLCQMRGGWLVPARSARNVIGVWHGAANYVIVGTNGIPHRVHHGEGLVVAGECSALAGKK